MLETEPNQPLARTGHRLLENTVRAGPLMSIPAILRDLGCAPAPVFERAGLDMALFGDADNEIPFTAGARLLAACVAATQCRHFGLLVGERASGSTLGVAGFMLRSAPDVGTALRVLVRHLDLHDRGGVSTLLTQGGQALFSYAICQPGVKAADQIYDLAVAIICNILRDLCGAAWNPAEVLLSRRAPTQLAQYQQFFRAPLRFDAEQSALAFPARWLEHPLESADPLLFGHLQREAEALHAHQEVTMTDRLRRLLRKSLAHGKCAATDVARQLCMHERTLHRRLEQEGTTYRRELEKIRYEMARQLLSESSTPLSRIAHALGYADASVFIRSFKRWSGATPAQWRGRQGDS